MNCVSLIGTVHDEAGLATVSELVAILAAIRPDVIFLEVPPAAFSDHYENCSRANLESKAIRQYQDRASHQVKLVPVDLPTPDEDFFEDTYNLRKSIWEASPEYRWLRKCEVDYVSVHGFAYLNSDHHSRLCCDMHAEMQSTLGKINDSRLTGLFELWNKTNDLREKEWMKNIQKYCRENTFNKGVFLVGAAHRQPIIDKSKERSAVDSTMMQWDFSACQMPRHS